MLPGACWIHQRKCIFEGSDTGAATFIENLSNVAQNCSDRKANITWLFCFSPFNKAVFMCQVWIWTYAEHWFGFVENQESSNPRPGKSQCMHYEGFHVCNTSKNWLDYALQKNKTKIVFVIWPVVKLCERWFSKTCFYFLLVYVAIISSSLNVCAS